ISQNGNQIPKSLWTQNGVGEKINVVRTHTDNDEGKYVADMILEMKLRNHYQNKDFAILYRTNAQSRAFEENLRKKNIPYKIYGGISFYQRKEIKDFLAYLRVIVNPRDEENLKRIINYPVRGIGKTSLDRLILYASESGITLWEALQKAMSAGLKGASAQAIEKFVLMIKSLQTMLEKENAYKVALAAGKESGLVLELYNDKSVEGLARYENIQELLNAIKEFTETPDEEGELRDKSLGNYLQQITLLTDADNEEEDADTVKLMTIHAAKGLEFPCVFNVGLEENLFPSAMSLYDRSGLEEERRLFYVAVTRAKEKLWITYANSRYRFGSLVQNDPSRFLAEIPAEFIDQHYTGIASPQALWGSTGNIYSQEKVSSFKKIADKIQQQKSITTHQPSANFQPDDPKHMNIGMKVEHQKFGFGTILSLEGSVQ